VVDISLNIVLSLYFHEGVLSDDLRSLNLEFLCY